MQLLFLVVELKSRARHRKPIELVKVENTGPVSVSTTRRTRQSEKADEIAPAAAPTPIEAESILFRRQGVGVAKQSENRFIHCYN